MPSQPKHTRLLFALLALPALAALLPKMKVISGCRYGCSGWSPKP